MVSLVLAVITNSCMDFYRGNEGTFSINIGRSARAALSWDDSVDSTDLIHTITVTNNTGGFHKAEGIPYGKKVQFSVAAGLWNIVVQAYLGEELIAEGFTDVNIKRGANGAINIKMNPPAVTTVFYTVTFYDGNELLDELTEVVESGAEIELPVLEKAGFAFQGWQINGEGALYNGAYTVTGSISLYTRWNPKVETVIEITAVELEDAAVDTLSEGLTLSRSGNSAADITVQNGESYNGGISWIYNGETLEIGTTITLNVDPAYSGHNYVYNFIGEHLLTVRAVKDGVPYTITVKFEVTP